jgi:hypothetical protein
VVVGGGGGGGVAGCRCGPSGGDIAVHPGPALPGLSRLWLAIHVRYLPRCQHRMITAPPT